MCQLRVRVAMPDQNEELLAEVTNVPEEGKNITLPRLFEPPRELPAYAIQHIDCIHKTVLLVPCAIDCVQVNLDD